MLDFIADNTRTGHREIYRDGRLLAHVSKLALSAPLLKSFDAVGPWGAFPDLPRFHHHTAEA